MLFHEEVGRSSETLCFNDSTGLGDPRMMFLIPMWKEKSRSRSTASAWGFSYPEYQTRHAAPGIDLADRCRSLEEA